MDNIEQLSLTIQSLNGHPNDSIKANIHAAINDLIENDFNRLVLFLYRVDVDENKLNQLLHDHPQTDAAVLITDLLIERQLEKTKVKKSFPKSDDIDEEERW